MIVPSTFRTLHFRAVMSYGFVGRYQGFGDINCLSLQGGDQHWRHHSREDLVSHIEVSCSIPAQEVSCPC
jgi:hypothetical protein